MSNIKSQGKLVYLITVTLFILASTTACNSNSSTLNTEEKKADSTNVPSSTIGVKPTITPIVSPPVTTVSAITSSSPMVTTTTGHSALIGKLPLPYEVQRADKVFIAQILKIGELVWDTPDGKEVVDNDPLQTTYNYTPEQLAPVEIIVTNSLKGSLFKGEKLTVLFPGAPSAKPHSAVSKFPKANETLLWFVGNEVDYRRGSSSTPLLTLNIQTYYFLQSDGTFISSADNTSTISVSNVQQAISNPPQDPNSVAASLVPTPIVKAGQSVNLVKLHNLDKTQFIMIKGNTSKNGSRITDPNQIQAVVSTLNITLVGMEDLSPPSPQNADNVLIVFNFSNGDQVSFVYNLKLGYLTSDRTDYRVPAPPNLRAALGL